MELALVLPLLLMFLFGIVIFGLGVFYQAQITNAAREAARFAAIHSASDQFCPVVSNLPPSTLYYTPPGGPPAPCDRPSQRWPNMTAAARNSTFGIPKPEIHVSACWSGFWEIDPGTGAKAFGNKWDALPPDSDAATPPTKWFDCRIGGVYPKVDPGSISCPAPLTSASDDEGSDIPGNHVTAYVCYEWTPPLAGFLVLPESITMRAVVTELIHRQQ